MKERSVGSSSEAIAATPWYDANDLRWAVRQWAARIGVRVKRIQVRALRSKWASMSSAGTLTLSTDLLQIPVELGEYVIVHELVHLLAPNHGKVFKSFMLAYMPDWETRADLLRSTYESKLENDGQND